MMDNVTNKEGKRKVGKQGKSPTPVDILVVI